MRVRWPNMAKMPLLYKHLRSHFATNPAKLPVLERTYASYERANLHLAIEELAKSADAPPILTGIILKDYDSVSLSKLTRPETAAQFDMGPVEYVDVALPSKQRLSCVKRGLYLLFFEGKPLALLISEQRHGPTPELLVEFMAPSRENAEHFAQRLERTVRHSSAFRGHVLSLESNCYGTIGIKFHSLPAIAREQVILPAALLDRIERHTVAFSKHAERLAAAGRHLKRGILLHGPPGTGKTLSAMYLASRMPGRTVFLLTGEGMGSIEKACQMARMLAPATIILEDVDLIGTQRNFQTVGANSLLFELLNQMDGLADDADILFVLTTNRPDVLEPALASRPGRIDQAIEVPPPDEDCRRRLFALYSQGLTLDINRLDEFINRLSGVSAAFIRELLRKAAVFAAIDSPGTLVVTDHHIDEALSELLVAGGTLTQSLLGANVK